MSIQWIMMVHPNKLFYYHRMFSYSCNRFFSKDCKMNKVISSQIKNLYLNKFMDWQSIIEFNLIKIFAIFLLNLYQKQNKSIKIFLKKALVILQWEINKIQDKIRIRMILKFNQLRVEVLKQTKESFNKRNNLKIC
jgi:hypothetical protein